MLKAIVRKEADSLVALEVSLTTGVVGVVEKLLACEGRVALSGVGETGLIAQKISATLASTGTPSYWLDPVNAQHGDLVMVELKDTVIKSLSPLWNNITVVTFRVVVLIGFLMIPLGCFRQQESIIKRECSGGVRLQSDYRPTGRCAAQQDFEL